MWKSSALRKTMFVHCANFIMQEMAGNTAHDHLPLLTFFNIFFFECCGADAQVRGNTICFSWRNIYHKHFAAGTTFCAINLRSNLVV